MIYVTRPGETVDALAVVTSDAIAIEGASEEEILAAQDNLTWNPREDWVVDSFNDFGLTMGLMKTIRRGISVTSALVGGLMAPMVQTPTFAWESAAFDRSITTVVKLDLVGSEGPLYVIEEATSTTVKVRFTIPEAPEVPLTSARVTRIQIDGEYAVDLDDSQRLAGVKFASLKMGMKAAAIGATLVIFGGQAIIAFRDGDIVKGTVYVSAGVVSTFGVLKGDVEILQSLARGRLLKAGFTLKFGFVAAVAVGGILAGYELFSALQSSDPFDRLSHCESAGGIAVDSLLGAIPLYGAAALIGWQVGLGLAIWLQLVAGRAPDILAVRVASSPGSAIAFLFEYISGVTIPSEIAKDALSQLLAALLDTMARNNTSSPPVPTIVVIPQYA